MGRLGHQSISGFDRQGRQIAHSLDPSQKRCSLQQGPRISLTNRADCAMVFLSPRMERAMNHRRSLVRSVNCPLPYIRAALPCPLDSLTCTTKPLFGALLANTRRKPCPPPPRSNLSETKPRSLVESITSIKKDSKTKLNEADKKPPKQERQARRENRRRQAVGGELLRPACRR